MNNLSMFFSLFPAIVLMGCMGLPGASDADDASNLFHALKNEIPFTNAADGHQGIFVGPRTRYTEVQVIGIYLKDAERARIIKTLKSIYNERKGKPIKASFFREKTGNDPSGNIYEEWIK